MTVTAWIYWIGFEVVVALAVFGKAVSWFGQHVRITPAGLESWTGLLLLALFAAIGLTQWLGTSPMAALIAFGLASGVIVSGAVNAAYEAGRKDGERIGDGGPR